MEEELLMLYANGQVVENKYLYDHLRDRGSVEPVGRSGVPRNLLHRKIRWAQQTLKHKGLLKRVKRGAWTLTGKGSSKLCQIHCDQSLLAFSTELGMAVWGDVRHVMSEHIREPVHLCFTSPPYPLKTQRAYGQDWDGEQEYIDFLSSVLEPVVDRLDTGGSIVLNVSNDIFNSGKPSRSLYLERLILAINERFGLELMDRHIWQSNKAPSPLIWSSKKRWQLNAQYEHVLWFCNDSLSTFASIDRVLEPHTEKHLKYVRSGGVKSEAKYGDGAYHKREGDFSSETKGRIPHNVYYKSNYCHSGRVVNQYARELGLPAHGAKMPRKLCDFYIEYLTKPNQMVLDPFAGTVTTGESAERLGRRWMCFDRVWEYLRTSFARFEHSWVNPAFLGMLENRLKIN